MKLLNLVSSTFLFSVNPSAPAQGWKEVQTNPIVQKIDSLMDNTADFSGVILVASKGRIHYHKALVLRTIRKNCHLTLQTFLNWHQYPNNSPRW
jgi:hypothetical protein